MAFLYDDELAALNGGGGDSTVIAPVGTGIGLAPQQAPAPVEARSPTRTRLGAREEMLAGMSPSEKFFGAMGDIGRGLQGKPLRIDAMAEERRKEKLIKLQEIKLFSDTTKDVLDTADRLTGDARTKYIQAKADQLNSASPGSGDMLTNFADDPDYAKMVLKYAAKSPTLKTALETGGIRAARDLMKTGKGAERIRSEIESAAFPDIRKKLTMLGQAAQDLLPPERYKQILNDGFISPVEASEINDAARGHEKYKATALTDEELSLANKNEDAVYGLAGMATSKTAQELMKERAKQLGKQENAQSDLGKLKVDLDKGLIDQKTYDAKVKKLTTHQPAVSVYSASLTEAIDEDGNRVFIQPSAHEGVPPRIVKNLKPPKKPGEAKDDKESEQREATASSVRARIEQMSGALQKESGIVGPAGIVRRGAEAVAGVVAPGMATPAIDYQNNLRLLVADVRKVVEKDPNLSNQERQNLYETLGGGTFQTPGSAIRTLNNVMGYVEGKAATGKSRGASLETAVKAAGWGYEPDKYEYRLQDGKVQRKAKDK